MNQKDDCTVIGAESIIIKEGNIYENLKTENLEKSFSNKKIINIKDD